MSLLLNSLPKNPTYLRELQRKAFAAYIKKTWGWTQKNMNRIIIIDGNPGSGKSWTALTYMYLFYTRKLGHPPTLEEFPFENIVFEPLEFLDRVSQTEREVILFDEGGVGANARRWYTKSNIALGQVVQTMRFKRHIILITVPRLGMIDKQIRDLAHEIHIVSGTRKGNLNLVFARELVYDSHKDEANRMYPAFLLPFNGNRVVTAYVRSMWVPAPPKWLADKYEEMSQEFKMKVLQDAKNKIIEIDGGVSGKTLESAISAVLKVLAQYPQLVVNVISERQGIAKFSHAKLRKQFPDAVPKEFSKLVAERLNDILLGAEEGIPTSEYYLMLQTGELQNKIKKLWGEMNEGKG